MFNISLTMTCYFVIPFISVYMPIHSFPTKLLFLSPVGILKDLHLKTVYNKIKIGN